MLVKSENKVNNNEWWQKTKEYTDNQGRMVIEETNPFGQVLRTTFIQIDEKPKQKEILLDDFPEEYYKEDFTWEDAHERKEGIKAQ